MITESELNELRFALIAANAKVAGLVKERDDAKARNATQEWEWGVKFSEQDNEIEGLREKMQAAEARNARLAETLTIRIDGHLWGFIRSVMTQAHAQQQDYMNGKHAGYEEFSAWIDRAAIEREKELIKLLNDRVAAVEAVLKGETK